MIRDFSKFLETEVGNRAFNEAGRRKPHFKECMVGVVVEKLYNHSSEAWRAWNSEVSGLQRGQNMGLETGELWNVCR